MDDCLDCGAPFSMKVHACSLLFFGILLLRSISYSSQDQLVFMHCCFSRRRRVLLLMELPPYLFVLFV